MPVEELKAALLSHVLPAAYPTVSCHSTAFRPGCDRCSVGLGGLGGQSAREAAFPLRSAHIPRKSCTVPRHYCPCNTTNPCPHPPPPQAKDLAATGEVTTAAGTTAAFAMVDGQLYVELEDSGIGNSSTVYHVLPLAIPEGKVRRLWGS